MKTIYCGLNGIHRVHQFKTGETIMIQASVGRVGQNNRSDVRIIQQLLNKIEIPGCEKLVVDGMAGARTEFRIEAFQKMLGVRKADGRIDPNGATLKALMSRTGTTNTVPEKLQLNDPKTVITDGVTVRFKDSVSQAKRDVVSQKTIDVIKRAFTMAGVNYAVISSTIREPQEQAQYVLDAALDSGKAQYTLARTSGLNDEIKKQRKAGVSTSEIKKMIAKKIEEFAEAGNRMSLHCVPLSVYNRLNVVDIGLGSTEEVCRNKKATYDPDAVTSAFWALENQGVIKTFIDETGRPKSTANNGAWHIEVPQ